MTDHELDEAVARALRALPDLEPPAGAWHAIAARLGRRRVRARSRSAPLVAFGALSVAVLALALWPALRRAPALRPVPPPDASPAAPASDLALRSAQLEGLLAALPPSRATRASTASTTALLEDRIALVDERLSGAPEGRLPPATTAALMRERVMLLDSLVRVRYAASVGQTP